MSVCECLCVFVLVSRFPCGGFKVLVWSCSLPPFPGPPFPGPPSPGPPCRSFCPLSSRKIRSFLPSLGVFSLNFGGVFEGRNPQIYTFGLSGCPCETWAAPPDRAAGASHDSPRTPNVHISGPRRFKHHQNSTKRPQERGRKEERILRRDRGKKARNFGPPHPANPLLANPHPSGPTFSGLGPPPFEPPPFEPPRQLKTHKKT